MRLNEAVSMLFEEDSRVMRREVWPPYIFVSSTTAGVTIFDSAATRRFHLVTYSPSNYTRIYHEWSPGESDLMAEDWVVNGKK